MNNKKEFESYIIDKNISFFERWDKYVSASSEMKNKNDGIITFNSKFLKYVLENISSYIDKNVNKINVSEFFKQNVYKGEIDMNLYHYDFDMTPKDIQDGLEELLEMNLEYFCIN